MRLCELFALILLANQVRQTRVVSVIKVCSIQLMRRWELFALILALFALVWYLDRVEQSFVRFQHIRDRIVTLVPLKTNRAIKNCSLRYNNYPLQYGACHKRVV